MVSRLIVLIAAVVTFGLAGRLFYLKEIAKVSPNADMLLLAAAMAVSCVIAIGFSNNFSSQSKQRQPARDQAAKLAVGLLDNEILTMRRQAAARDAGGPCAFLWVAVPIGEANNSGWFGGSPKLPTDIDWPARDETPLKFLCQISLAALPQGIWAGVGPRTGWLAVFMHPENMDPVVLHVDGDLEERDGPAHTDAVWFYPRKRTEAPLMDHLPKLPFKMSAHVGALPDPMLFSMGKAPGFPDIRDTEVFDLADPIFHPFDGRTLRFLLDSIQEALKQSSEAIRQFESQKLTKNDLATLNQAKETMAETHRLFAGLHDKLCGFVDSFELSLVRPLIVKLARLRIVGIQYLDVEQDGTAVLKFFDVELSEDVPAKPSYWRFGYLQRLYRQGLHQCANGTTLPEPQLQRLEEIWFTEALYHTAAMGHAPVGHVRTPYGPSTTNELLLELRTSKLLGWIWGDVYSVVFLINRDDLKAGNFGNVTAEITS